MSRRKRIVIPNLPHHVTQRGGRRQDIFFTDRDRVLYLALLAENAQRYGVEILEYCLMTNHVHHLLVPVEEDSLRWTLQLTHKRYADYINSRKGWSGHLWQQRFYSSPVDEEYFWITIRYILRNPVEAGLVKHPSDYRWSGARARCEKENTLCITTQSKWLERLQSRDNWCDWLEGSDPVERIALLRKRTATDLPTGSTEFLNELEEKYGVVANPRPVGRPQKK